MLVKFKISKVSFISANIVHCKAVSVMNKRTPTPFDKALSFALHTARQKVSPILRSPIIVVIGDVYVSFLAISTMVYRVYAEMASI